MHRMRRRELISGLSAIIASFSLVARAEPKLQRIAIVAVLDPVAVINETSNRLIWRQFFGELRRLGYVEGQNLIIDRFSVEGHPERHADMAREVVARAPNVIVVNNNVAARAYKRATSSIPIVAWMGFPVEAGLVASLARPGGNITGVTSDAGPEYGGKRLELLKQTIPGMSRVIWLAMTGDEDTPGAKIIRDVATSLQIDLIELRVQNAIEDEIRRAFDTIARERPDALFVSYRSEFYGQRRLIVQLAEKTGIGAMYFNREFVELGGLMSYATTSSELVPRMVSQVDRILKGASPADIPVEQMTKYELVINLNTAKALGLTIPQSILARAEVIE